MRSDRDSVAERRTERPPATDWTTRLRETPSGSQRKAVYAEYLRSGVWRGIRARIIERDGTCQDCGAAKQLQVHHLTYKRVGGGELDQGLVTLCGPCHNARHGLDRPKRRKPKPAKRGPSKNAKKRAKKAKLGYTTQNKRRPSKRVAKLEAENDRLHAIQQHNKLKQQQRREERERAEVHRH